MDDLRLPIRPDPKGSTRNEMHRVMFQPSTFITQAP